jgi:hypothetical protein
MLMKSSKKVATFFSCNSCDYTTSKKYNLEKHEMTLKHKMLTNANEKEQKVATFSDPHVCRGCNKQYKHKSSLCRHQNNCEKSNLDDKEEKCEEMKNLEMITIDKEKLELMKINLKLKGEVIEKQNKIIELSKDKNTTINNNLNINVFLNEKCKNAMNITDFMDQITLSVEDLFYTKNNGYIDGVSNIFIKHLEELEPTNRPIHCSNKRGTQMYIKDDDKWEQDKNGKFENQITHITKKHGEVLKEWENEHPNWMDTEKDIQTYMELIQKIMGGSNDEDREKNVKLIKKKVSKNTNFEKITI